MSIAVAHDHKATGPILGPELRAVPEEPERPPQSSMDPHVPNDLLKLASRKFRGQGNVERSALLGVLLARLVDVPFEEVAELLRLRPQRLEKLMHGEEVVPKSAVGRWEAIAEILLNLHAVLRPEATVKWLRAPIPALDGRTPMAAIQKGDTAKVLEVARSYRDPSFA